MTSASLPRPVSALRARMIEDMRVRGFSEKTRNDYIRNVRSFAAFIGRSPDTAMAEDLRRFQLHQSQTGVRPPSINSAVAALRFFFTGIQTAWQMGVYAGGTFTDLLALDPAGRDWLDGLGPVEEDTVGPVPDSPVLGWVAS